jgi:hypothetical protein
MLSDYANVSSKIDLSTVSVKTCRKLSLTLARAHRPPDLPPS